MADGRRWMMPDGQMPIGDRPKRKYRESWILVTPLFIGSDKSYRVESWLGGGARRRNKYSKRRIALNDGDEALKLFFQMVNRYSKG